MFLLSFLNAVLEGLESGPCWQDVGRFGQATHCLVTVVIVISTSTNVNQPPPHVLLLVEIIEPCLFIVVRVLPWPGNRYSCELCGELWDGKMPPKEK